MIVCRARLYMNVRLARVPLAPTVVTSSILARGFAGWGGISVAMCICPFLSCLWSFLYLLLVAAIAPPWATVSCFMEQRPASFTLIILIALSSSISWSCSLNMSSLISGSTSPWTRTSQISIALYSESSHCSVCTLSGIYIWWPDHADMGSVVVHRFIPVLLHGAEVMSGNQNVLLLDCQILGALKDLVSVWDDREPWVRSLRRFSSHHFQ